MSETSLKVSYLLGRESILSLHYSCKSGHVLIQKVLFKLFVTIIFLLCFVSNYPPLPNLELSHELGIEVNRELVTSNSNPNIYQDQSWW